MEAACRAEYGDDVVTRPLWMRDAYGDGAQLVRALRNVVFSDGEKDPWRVGGVPDNASAISPDGSVVHILIDGAAHHQDLRATDPRDPESVRAAKRLEAAHIRRWLGL